MADQLGRTLVGVIAQFCLLESQDHWLLVKSLFTVTILCTVYPRVHHSVTLHIKSVNEYQICNSFN